MRNKVARYETYRDAQGALWVYDLKTGILSDDYLPDRIIPNGKDFLKLAVDNNLLTLVWSTTEKGEYI